MIVGIDEVGRGPLAGPVVACALRQDPRLDGLEWADSKALSSEQRQSFLSRLQGLGIPHELGQCDAAEVDALNILQATFLAMRRAVERLERATGERVEHALVDGPHDPGLSCAVTTVVKGDAQVPCIGAASIVAKEARDQQMIALADQFPAYGLDRHKGYGTAEHLEALAQKGPCPEHRLSFAPVRRAVVAGRHQRGRDAEERAVRQLEAAGHEILARNWTGRRGELDVVADNGLELVVVEVRSRSDQVDPLETLVSRSKWTSIRRATDEFLYRSRLEERFVRFDVVGVRGDQLEWVEDAWRPA